MKTAFLKTVLLIILFSSCKEKKRDIDPNSYQTGVWYLTCYHDNGWSHSTVSGDSIQMISITEAYIWNNGRRTKIVAEKIVPLYIQK